MNFQFLKEVLSILVPLAALIWAMFSHRDKKITAALSDLKKAIDSERSDRERAVGDERCGREQLEKEVAKATADISALQEFLRRSEQIQQSTTAEIKEGMRTFAAEMKNLAERMVDVKDSLQTSIHEVRDKVIEHIASEKR